jgi:capsular polysaccharide transport system permease protein
MEATPVTEPMRRPRASPLAINAAVIGAILLRDIKLRAGPYYTGFLMILLLPLAHLLIIVIVFHIFGRLAPQGTDQMVYFGISILPFVIFTYLARQIVMALAENRPLLYFNRVKVFPSLFLLFSSAYWRFIQPIFRRATGLGSCSRSPRQFILAFLLVFPMR